MYVIANVAVVIIVIAGWGWGKEWVEDGLIYEQWTTDTYYSTSDTIIVESLIKYVMIGMLLLLI